MKFSYASALLMSLVMLTSFKKERSKSYDFSSCSISIDGNTEYCTELANDTARGILQINRVWHDIVVSSSNIDQIKTDTCYSTYIIPGSKEQRHSYSVFNSEGQITLFARLNDKGHATRLRWFRYDPKGQLAYTISEKFYPDGELFISSCRAFYSGDTYWDDRPEQLFPEFMFKDSTVYIWKDGDLIQQVSYIHGSNDELCNTQYSYYKKKWSQITDPIMYSQYIEYGFVPIHINHLLQSTTYKRSDAREADVTQYKFKFGRQHRIMQTNQLHLSYGRKRNYGFVYNSKLANLADEKR